MACPNDSFNADSNEVHVTPENKKTQKKLSRRRKILRQCIYPQTQYKPIKEKQNESDQS